MKLSALPFELSARGPDGAQWTTNGTALEMVAAPGSDLFIDPTTIGQSTNLTRLTGEVTGPFQLSARVTVDFRHQFDAGVLLVWITPTKWLKLCFEFSPAGQGTIVSVVTREVSDDANSWNVTGDTVFLRISRLQHAFALHSSTDGHNWALVRVCSLGVPIDQPIEVGFLSQSPVGPGCRSVFDSVSFSRQELTDIRNGT